MGTILSGMASATLIPLSEYLKTSYRPDCDYIDGELKDRNLGEQPHGHEFRAIVAFHLPNENRKELVYTRAHRREPCTDSVRPAFAFLTSRILRSSDPLDPIVRFAPYICIEVLSKDDTLMEIRTRVDEYRIPWASSIHGLSIPGYALATSRPNVASNSPADGVFSVPGHS